MSSLPEPRLETPRQQSAAGIRDRADPRLVLADRVNQLYNQLPVSIAATFVAGARTATRSR